ncbi:MAG: pilus assembly protein [Chloroflexi bacterium]|nr:MAG: pilus assembly protein [Chloroflexota bacterium]
MRELIDDEGGVGVIELALIVPLLILLTVGVLDVARAMNAAVVLESASQDAVHAAVLDPSATIPPGQAVPPPIASAARGRVAPLDGSSITVTVQYYDSASGTFRPWPTAGIPTSSPNPVGVMVRVNVSYPWTAVSALAAGFLSPAGPRTLTSTSIMETRR